MNLKDIMSISGHSGLFKFIAQGRNGVIVEGLVDKKRMNASATSRISALEDIAVYTEEKEVALAEVFRMIFQKENGAAVASKANDSDVKKYFAEILPTYDRDKVYVSDMKKVISWYNILQSQNMVDLVVEEKKEGEEPKEEKVAEPAQEEPKKAEAKPKKAAAKKGEAK
jgi:hypothetical protein